MTVPLLGDAGTAILEIVVGVLGGAVIGVLGLYFQQRNRRGDMAVEQADKAEGQEDRHFVAMVRDTENALKAWKEIDTTRVEQIHDLQAQVGELRTRLVSVEGQLAQYRDDIVPQMQDTINGLRGVISEKQTTINQMQETVAQLLEKIEKRIM